MTKLMIATPAFGNKVTAQYAMSLSYTMQLLASHNIECQLLITDSSSLLVAERNRIIEAFWKSDCTHILCIDADIGWPAEAVISMLDTGKEFVAGLYPMRTAENVFVFRPIQNPDGSIVQDQTHRHLLKMEYIPAGFMLIAKSAFLKMREKHPDLYYRPKDLRDTSEDAYCFFNTEVLDNEFWGEDYVFCRKTTQAGIDIWVDPLIQFDHAGKVGMFLDALHQKHPTNQTISEAA